MRYGFFDENNLYANVDLGQEMVIQYEGPVIDMSGLEKKLNSFPYSHDKEVQQYNFTESQWFPQIHELPFKEYST